MCLTLTMNGWHGDVEPMIGLAMRVRALGAAVQEWDAPVATYLMPTGGWR